MKWFKFKKSEGYCAWLYTYANHVYCLSMVLKFSGANPTPQMGGLAMTAMPHFTTGRINVCNKESIS